MSRVGVHKFLRVYETTHTIQRRSGSGRPSKITPEIKALVEHQMNLDDETTASQLHQLLIENRILISLKTILRCRTQLGWTFRGSAYCQLIRNVNKQKRLEWARNNLAEAESGFLDVMMRVVYNWRPIGGIHIVRLGMHPSANQGAYIKCTMLTI